jgi:predicted nucleotidyltransferase
MDDAGAVDLEAYVELARRIVVERFPAARAAVLAGSMAAGIANEHSDLDVVVVLDAEPAPFRETLRVGGRPVELFVHTTASLEHWYEREHDRSGTLGHMVALGIPLLGDLTDGLQAEARAYVDAGPAPWTAAQLERGRYLVTDALDDLAGARDDDERDAVAGHLLVLAADLHLAAHRRWQGTGKWLVRRLRESDPVLAEQLLGGHRAVVATGATGTFVAAIDQVLAPLGGRLTEGYTAR